MPASYDEDLPEPLTTRNLLPSPSRSEPLSASSSSPYHSFLHESLYYNLSNNPQDSPQLNSFPSNSTSVPWNSSEFTNPSFMADSTTMNHHFENDLSSSQPRRTRKKELFADSVDPLSTMPSFAGPSNLAFYNQGQPSEPGFLYGVENTTIATGLKRKREASLEPLEPWHDGENRPNPMSMPIELDADDDDSPLYTISRDRKGKGKEVDYKGKGKQREVFPEDSPIFISDSPIIINNVQPTTNVSSKPLSEPFANYTCPICFSAPTNATLTPCGHICCGECLFTAVKTVMQRSQQVGAPDAREARCPVCRALIPGWDGEGGGVIGLKVRALFSL